MTNRERIQLIFLLYMELPDERASSICHFVIRITFLKSTFARNCVFQLTVFPHDRIAKRVRFAFR